MLSIPKTLYSNTTGDITMWTIKFKNFDPVEVEDDIDEDII